jgi:hypothetical protein
VYGHPFLDPVLVSEKGFGVKPSMIQRSWSMVLFGVTTINFSSTMWEKMIKMEYIPPGFPARYFMLGGD